MSKLAQMQARFQQRQMQEKEEKLLKLYENQQQRAFERVGRGSAGSNTSSSSIGTTGGGKVRQMFDERRQKAGVDKSYPLEPLKNRTTARVPGLERNINATSRTVVKTTVKKSVSQIRNGKPLVSQRETLQKSYNNNLKNDVFEEHTRIEDIYDNIDSHNNLVDLMNNHNLDDDLENEEMPQIGFNEDFDDKPLYMKGKLANVGGKLPSQIVEIKPLSNGLSQRNGVNKQQTRVSPKKPIAKTTPPPRTSSTVSSASSQSSRSSPARSVNNMSAKQASPRAPTNTRPSAKQTAKSPVVRDDLAECRYCGRRFATDRLGTHEDICGKTGKKKRKVFDSTKHRVQGTELEGYVLKGGKKAGSSKKTKDPTSSKDIKVSAKSSVPKAANWRRTHEEFIATIRAAKQAQAHVAQGGKLSDLPPPPPSTNPDYVQCPHCGRRFNEAAAQRHIPKCATFQFNKPKAGTPGQKGRPGKR